MRLQEIQIKTLQLFEQGNELTKEQEYELFIDAIQSEDFLYTRERRTSQYSNQYTVIAYLKDDNSTTGKWGVASLPEDLASKALHDHGKNKSFGSII